MTSGTQADGAALWNSACCCDKGRGLEGLKLTAKCSSQELIHSTRYSIHEGTGKGVQKAEGWKYKPQHLQCGKARTQFWMGEELGFQVSGQKSSGTWGRSILPIAPSFSTIDFEARLSWFKFECCHELDIRLGVNCLATLRLSFLICKMEVLPSKMPQPVGARTEIPRHLCLGP